MKFEIPSFEDGERIPAEFAFAVIHPTEHVTLSGNRNPHLKWSELPEGTRSLAIVCYDPDVPSVGDDVNQEGRSVPIDLPRVDFTHWILVDVDPALGEIRAGADSDGVTAKGKDLGKTPLGVRGRNDYTAWFAGDVTMGGTYAGYDGPGPPWNDELTHRYIFSLHALDIESLGLEGDFSRAEVQRAMEGHVLEEAFWVGTYSLNAELV